MDGISRGVRTVLNLCVDHFLHPHSSSSVLRPKGARLARSSVGSFVLLDRVGDILRGLVTWHRAQMLFSCDTHFVCECMCRAANTG